MKKYTFYVIPICCIIIIGALLYANSLNNVFVLDDFITIKDNESIRSLTYIPYFLRTYFRRSIFYISLAINYYFCGLNPAGYHLVNIVIHILNAIILYLFLCALCEKRLFLSNRFFYSFIPSIIFLIHPIQANTINHITTRSITLCTLFYLTSLLFYIYGRESNRRFKKNIFYICAILSFVLCIGSKSIGITLPIMVFILNRYFYRDEGDTYNRLSRFDVLIIVFCLTFLLTIILFGDVMQIKYHSMINNLITQFDVVVRYLMLIIIPIDIVPQFDIPIKEGFDLRLFVSITVIAILIYVAIRTYRKNRLFSLSLVWYFITIAPSSSIIPRANPMLLYRLYLPIIGWCIICGVLMHRLHRIIKSYRIRIALVMTYFLIIIFLCSLTLYQNNLYNSNINLWKKVKEKFPDNPVPYFNIGTFLIKQNRLDEAIDYFKMALERKTLYAKAHFHLGLAYQLKGMIDDAIEEYENALRIRPYSYLMKVNYGIYINLGNAYFKKDDYEKALWYYNKYIQDFMTTSQVLNNVYHVYKKRGNFQKALSSINKAIDIDKGNLIYRLNRADLYLENDEYIRAESEYKEVLMRDSLNLRALFKLGVLYQETNRCNEAMNVYRNTLKINEFHVGALNNAGVILYNEGDIEGAQRFWVKILTVSPDHKGARENLNRIIKIN